jgi:hypothetical protein
MATKRKKRSHPLLLPDRETGWSFIAGSASSPGSDTPMADPSELPEHASGARGVTLGLPATRCLTIAFSLNTTEAALLRPMVSAQLESRGLVDQELTDNLYQFHILETKENRTLVSVDILTGTFPAEWCVPAISSFQPAARLYRLPENQLVAWMEQGHWMLGATVGNQLAFTHILPANIRDSQSLQREINLFRLGLECDGLLDGVTDLTVTGEDSEHLIEAFTDLVDLSVHSLRELPPLDTADFPDRHGELIPPPLLEIRQRSKIRSKRRKWATGMTAAWIAGLCLLALFNLRLTTRLDALESQYEDLGPIGAELTEAAARWGEVEDCVDPLFYPMEILYTCVHALPLGGVRISRFEFLPTKEVRLRGQARDAQTAFLYLEDLKNDNNLWIYDWDMPQPRVLNDNSVTFVIQGKTKNAVTQ